LQIYHTQTETIQVDAQQPETHLIQRAAEVIRAGGLVAFPTETVYGLGANALDADAVAKIFRAKERPANDPIIVHVHDIAQVERIARDVPAMAYDLMAQFWAGALTLILQRSDAVPDNITSGKETVAIRMPNHPVALALLRQADVPIGAPSANRFSRPSPTSAQHVLYDLKGRVDVVLDGGATQIGVESTILDLTGDVPTVLRPGGVTVEAIRAFVPDVQVKTRYLQEDDTSVTAPGNLLKHYSPHAEMRLYRGAFSAVMAQMQNDAKAYAQAGKRVGLLVRDDEKDDLLPLDLPFVALGASDNDHARRLFAGIRTLDAQSVDAIFVRAPAEQGIGLAVWDRLVRAAEGRILDCN
jgi:L-threonylcarbamoyladenylate synthase